MSNSRYLWIAVIALLIGAGIYVGVGGRQNKSADKPTEAATSARTALNKLYAEAKRDLKNKKLPAAGAKFRQLANMAPNFKDADARAKAIAAQLLKEAEKDIANGDYPAAKVKLDAAGAADPTNKKIAKKKKEISKKPGGGSTAPDNSTTPDNNTPPGDSARAIPTDATPLSLLIGDISGYETIQNGWLEKPIEAGSTFIPTSTEVKSQIDRALWKIAKLGSKQAADDKLKEVKDAWPLDNEEVTVNGHSAYLGVYNFEKSPEFKLRQMATIAWTRNDWFFMIEVLPKSTPDSAYKKGVARDIAVKQGY